MSVAQNFKQTAGSSWPGGGKGRRNFNAPLRERADSELAIILFKNISPYKYNNTSTNDRALAISKAQLNLTNLSTMPNRTNPDTE